MKNTLLSILLFFAYSSFSQLPAKADYFAENKGQIIDQQGKKNQRVQFLFQNGNMNVQLRESGFSYDVFDLSKRKGRGGIAAHRVDIEFLGMSSDMEVIAENEVTFKSNYIKSNSSNATDIKHFDKIIYHNVYPQIDFVFKKDEITNAFKYDIVLYPGANISDIQLNYTGFNDIQLVDGNLAMETSIRTLNENIPLSYLLDSKREIEVDFTLQRITKNEAIVGFNVNQEDYLSEGLLIDPYPDLVWGKYIGDSLYTEVKGVITDRFSYSYICGSTQSVNHIATAGAHQDTIADSLINDAFLMKFHKHGGLMWSTYFGGEAEDIANDVYVDTSFNVFLTGTTFSHTGIVDSLGHQDSLAGNGDAFLAKFNESGQLMWSTYFGGDSLDQANKLSTDFYGNVYVAGVTSSASGISTPASHQPVLQGETDGFVAKFDSIGVLVWSSYIGGSGIDIANGIAYGDTSIYVVGETRSLDLLTDSTSHKASLNDSIDGFISKFNNQGQLVFQTYFGGEKYDVLNSVKVFNNNIYFVGTTLSDSSIVPNGMQAINAQITKGDTLDAFAGRMDNEGVLIWSSYIGGDSIDLGMDLFFELDSNFFVVGTTYSDSLFGVDSLSYQQINHGNGDLFMSKIERDGDVIWTTFYGGQEQETAEAIGVYGNTAIYVVGSTNSDSSMILPQHDVYPNTFNAEREGFFSKFNQGKSTLPSGFSCNGGSGGIPCDTCSVSPYDSVMPYYYCPGTEIALIIEGGELGTDADWVWYEAQCGNTQVAGVGDTLIVTLTQTVTYYVRAESITNATACVHSTFLVAPYPSYSISTDSLLCNNEELVLGISGASASGSIGNWTGPNDFTSNSLNANLGSANDSLEGMYYVYFTDEYNCSYEDSLSIMLVESPEVSALVNHIECYGNLDGSIVLTGDSLSTYDILWSTGLENSDSAINLSSGLYSVEVTNTHGCMYSDSFEVNSPLSVLLDTTITTTTCTASTGSIVLSLDTLFAPYQIMCNGIAQVGDSIGGLGYGDYEVQIENANGCIEEFTFFVDFANPLQIEVVEVIHSTCPSVHNGQAVVQGINGTPPYNYTWIPNASSDSIAIGLSPGLYYVSVIDSAGCEVSDSILIEGIYDFEVDFDLANSSCHNPTGSIEVIAQPEELMDYIIWATNDTTTSTSIDSIWAGIYELSVFDTLGCQYDYTVEIESNNDLSVEFSPSTVTLNEGDSVQLLPQTNCQNDCDYQWLDPTNSGLSCWDCLNPYSSAMQNTEYTIIVSDSLGCADSATVYIEVESPCVEVFIPTIFSPNGDGLNDEWFIIGTCIQTIHIKVFNQWGDMIFHTNDQSIGWDGTYNGALVPLDQYTYQVIVTYIGGGNEFFNGTVQVVY